MASDSLSLKFDPRPYYGDNEIEAPSMEEFTLSDKGATSFRTEFAALVERLQAPPPPPPAPTLASMAPTAGHAGRRLSMLAEPGSAPGQRVAHGPSNPSGVGAGRHHPPSAFHDAHEDDDLGVFHRVVITSFDNAESPRSAHSAKGAGRTEGTRQGMDQFAHATTTPKPLGNSMCEEQHSKALDVLGSYLAKLPRGALIFEIGSRCGEAITSLSRRFPSLWMQPTEGTGRTSHSLFALLDERIKQFGRELEQEGSSRAGHDDDGSAGRMLGAAGRVLKPRFFDAGKLSDWLVETHSHSNPSLVFAVNVLHFMPWKCVETIIDGSSRTLRSGALLFLCGPFLDNGQVSQENLLFHAALGDFAQSLCNRGEQVHWGLHDVQRIVEFAKACGLEMESKTQIGKAEHVWFAIVLRKPGITKTTHPATGLSSFQRRSLLAASKHMQRTALAR